MRIKTRLAATALAAAIGGATLLPVPAYANYDEAAAEPVAEVLAEGTEEDTEPMDPLTPDGNMTIVDDLGDHEESGKQFITVTTKDGNIFYIIIDRDDSGDNTVHFLNLVDEEDLMALVDDSYTEELEAQKQAVADAQAAAEQAQKEKEEAEKAASETSKEKSGIPVSAAVGILGILALVGGGIWYYINEKGPSKEAIRPDPDADYDEYDENDDVLEFQEDSEKDTYDDRDDSVEYMNIGGDDEGDEE